MREKQQRKMVQDIMKRVHVYVITNERLRTIRDPQLADGSEVTLMRSEARGRDARRGDGGEQHLICGSEYDRRLMMGNVYNTSFGGFSLCIRVFSITVERRRISPVLDKGAQAYAKRSDGADSGRWGGEVRLVSSLRFRNRVRPQVDQRNTD